MRRTIPPACKRRSATRCWGATSPRFPLGLETPVGTRGVTLSGGQVQRTALARMLVREADLLVIDDVSSALDVETERDLWRRLRERPDATILAVSHRRAALLQADQIVVLEEGRVAARGPLDCAAGDQRRDARALARDGRQSAGVMPGGPLVATIKRSQSVWPSFSSPMRAGAASCGSYPSTFRACSMSQNWRGLFEMP